jgi:hypothetical protein
MSSEQYLEATPIEQEKPLMISDNVWIRMSPIRRARACQTQKIIDQLKSKASIEVLSCLDIITLKFKSNKIKVYQQALEYLNKNYTFTSPHKTKGPIESHRYGIYYIEFHLLPWWQPWEYIPE